MRRHKWIRVFKPHIYREGGSWFVSSSILTRHWKFDAAFEYVERIMFREHTK